MKKLIKNITIPFIIIMVLLSCRSKKNAGCDAYSEYRISEDSTVVRVYHYHIEEQKKCYYKVETVQIK